MQQSSWKATWCWSTWFSWEKASIYSEAQDHCVLHMRAWVWHSFNRHSFENLQIKVGIWRSKKACCIASTYSITTKIIWRCNTIKTLILLYRWWLEWKREVYKDMISSNTMMKLLIPIILKHWCLARIVAALFSPIDLKFIWDRAIKLMPEPVHKTSLMKVYKIDRVLEGYLLTDTN